MMYKEFAHYECEENERFEESKLHRVYDGDEVCRPYGKYVDDICIDGIWCELYEDNGDYTAYTDITNDNDDDGEMIDRRYQEYVDSKYEN